MALEQVEYTCPMCGAHWVELQDINDEWFRLGTNQTLCAKCGQEAIRRIKHNWDYEEMFRNVMLRGHG